MTDVTGIRDLVLRGVADTRGEDYSDLARRAGGGNMSIDSKEAECVIAFVEDELGLGELASSADLTPEQLTNIDSLTELLTRLAEANSS